MVFAKKCIFSLGVCILVMILMFLTLMLITFSDENQLQCSNTGESSNYLRLY